MRQAEQPGANQGGTGTVDWHRANQGGAEGHGAVQNRAAWGGVAQGQAGLHGPDPARGLVLHCLSSPQGQTTAQHHFSASKPLALYSFFCIHNAGSPR